jgi:hypothetical protein
MKEVLLEAEREGTVARGFFGDYDYSVDGSVITVKIPFTDVGIDLLQCAKTPSIIEEIIKSEFGISYKVVIEQNGSSIMEMSNDYKARLENIDRQIHSAQERYTVSLRDAESRVSLTPEEERLPRLISVYGE